MCYLVKDDVGQKQWKRYLGTHSGRHDFQINLALSIMNYGVGLHWDGKFTTRLNFMRQMAFVPCDCCKCFFCLNNITSGIVHPPSKRAKVTVEYACRTGGKTNKCTSDRVSLGMTSGSYCRMCYRKQVSTELTASMRKKGARHLQWGVQYAKNQFVKSAGQRGTISICSIFLVF